MAAIIAQMAAANRARKKRQHLQKLYGMASNKSNVELQPWPRDHGFDAAQHNIYVKAQNEKKRRQMLIDQLTAERLEADEIFHNELQEERWLRKLNHMSSVTKVKPTMSMTEEFDILVKRQLSIERCLVRCFGLLKASVGIVMLAMFSFVLVYIFWTFESFIVPTMETNSQNSSINRVTIPDNTLTMDKPQ